MSPLGHTWDVDRTLIKPSTILSNMYLLEGSVTGSIYSGRAKICCGISLEEQLIGE